MTRTFVHSFEPAAASPVKGKMVDLEVSEIEDAGIREVLQTPGPAYGAWSILDALLTPAGAGTTFFTFKEPLGQAREVKVALSGLLGRFVARAYLERYFNLSIFAHLGNHAINLSRRRRIDVKRLVERGDLPDWVACAANLSSLTVAEAKGCHDIRGPAKALEGAWKQAHRIDVTVRGRKVTVKRIAIATRWGMATGGPHEPHLSVHDPLDKGDPIEPDDETALFIGLLRLHIANLIKPLGHPELADALYHLVNRSAETLQDDVERPLSLLDTAQMGKITGTHELIGGIVTRAGPITDTDLGQADQEVLARLNLRPIFVGIERDVILHAIHADPDMVRAHLKQPTPPDEFARPDGAGGWIVPLGQDRSTDQS